jgi:hypothetical protein
MGAEQKRAEEFTSIWLKDQYTMGCFKEEPETQMRGRGFWVGDTMEELMNSLEVL